MYKSSGPDGFLLHPTMLGGLWLLSFVLPSTWNCAPADQPRTMNLVIENILPVASWMAIGHTGQTRDQYWQFIERDLKTATYEGIRQYSSKYALALITDDMIWNALTVKIRSIDNQLSYTQDTGDADSPRILSPQTWGDNGFCITLSHSLRLFAICDSPVCTDNTYWHPTNKLAVHFSVIGGKFPSGAYLSPQWSFGQAGDNGAAFFSYFRKAMRDVFPNKYMEAFTQATIRIE